MALAHDADSNANSGTAAVASLTWSHTSTGSNLVLIVGLGWTGGSTTMSITHAANAPTGFTARTQDPGATYNSQIWWWVNPTTGAQNIIATPSISASIFGGGASFSGADQTTPVSPLETYAINGSSFGTVRAGQYNRTDGAAIFSLLAMQNATSTIAAVSPATQAFNQFDATAARTAGGEYLITSSHSLNYMDWTISGSTARNWTHQLIALNPTGGTPVPHTTFNNKGLRPHPFSPGLAR
jgi:hypothetical protein